MTEFYLLKSSYTHVLQYISVFQLLNRYLEIVHYGALRSAILEYNGTEMEQIAAQITISFIRYSDIMQADKVFYEAGMACRVRLICLLLSTELENNNLCLSKIVI